MFPTINKKETGVNLRRIMDMRGVKPKDIQEYLGFGCVQSVYRWLDGVSMPTVDNLYAISKMLQVPMDSIVCGNAGRTKSQMDACLTDQERRVYTYYKKMMVKVLSQLTEEYPHGCNVGKYLMVESWRKLWLHFKLGMI